MKSLIKWWDNICDKYYSDEKEVSPLSYNMHWRKSFHLSPSFNLFYYILMSFFIYAVYNKLITSIDFNHWIWEKLYLDNPYSNMFFSLIVSVSIVGLFFFLIGKVFYHKIKLAKTKPKVYMNIIQDKELLDDFINFLNHSNNVDITCNDNQSFNLNDVINEDYDFIITNVPLSNNDKKELGKINTRIIGLWKYEKEEFDFKTIAKVIKYEAPSLVKGAFFAKLIKYIPFIIDKITLSVSKGINVIGTINVFKFLIFIASLLAVGYIFVSIVFNSLLIKQLIILIGTIILGRYAFNVFYTIWTQVENIAISVSNTITEITPVQRIHYQLKKMNEAKSLHHWYYKENGFKDFLINNLDNVEWWETIKAQAMNGRVFEVITSGSVYCFMFIIYGFFKLLGTEKTPSFIGNLSIKHARNIIYIPVHLFIISVLLLNLGINYFLFTYACLFFISLWMLLGFSIYMFLVASSQIRNIIFNVDYSLFVKFTTTGYNSLYILLAIFLVYNVVMLYMNSISYVYYMGYSLEGKTINGKKKKIKKEGIFQKYILNWRKGISRNIIKIAILFALVSSLVSTFNNVSMFVSDNFKGYSLSSFKQSMINFEKEMVNKKQINLPSLDNIKKDLINKINNIKQEKK